MRLAIMCRAEVSLNTFKWLPGHNPPRLTAVAEGHHQCVKWDSMLAWVKERAVPIYEAGVLVGPDGLSE